MDNKGIITNSSLDKVEVDSIQILNQQSFDDLSDESSDDLSDESSQQQATMASWWLDFFTMAGHKSENQDSLLITTCLTGYFDTNNGVENPYETHTQNQTLQPSKIKPSKIQPSEIQPFDIQASKAVTSDAPLSHSTKISNTNKISPYQLPVLALLSDGVSACQFPKQASRLAVEIIAENIVEGLSQLHSETDIEISQFDIQAYQGIFDDESVAGIIKLALTKANDAMYFSQAYQRVPPLLATLSGVLCIGDRVHLFHTGDSRVYRVGADSLTILTEDHRITHGQDKGALSAALGADTRIDLQQMTFTLHQNEYLALMTDGVYEFIDPIEMQYEFSAAVTHLENTPDWNQLKDWQLSKQLCNLAFNEGSNDNLSIIMLGMGITPIESKSTSTVKVKGPVTELTEIDEDKQPNLSSKRFKLPTGKEPGDSVDGFRVDKIIARTARSDVYLVHDSAGNQYVLKSPSLMTVDDGHYMRDFLKERKIGLSLSKHRRAGEVAYNQTNPNHKNDDTAQIGLVGSGLSESGLLRYYPVPASSTYLYHLTEYIEGESLRVFMERNGPCDVWQTHDLLTKIGMAVRVMHRNFLLHQDIKPENILLTKSGAVKLIDFGSVASSILKDNTRPPVGDLHYAAPEYYTDAPKGVHSDLFSIAVIGFELLTGKLPFTSQMLMSPNDPLALSTELLRQKQVPATSQQALLRALHRNTNARHQAIGEFLQDFNPDSSASLADPEPLIKRNPLLVWHGICLIQFAFIVFLLIKFLPDT